MSSNAIQDLQELLDVAKSNGIKVIGVQYPLTAEYLEHSVDEENLSAEILTCREIPILDFRDTVTGRPELLRNADHLNENGQALFGNLLVRRLRPLLSATIITP